MPCIIQRCSEQAPPPTMTPGGDRKRLLDGSFKNAVVMLAGQRGKTLKEVLCPYYKNDNEASLAALEIQKEWCWAYLNSIQKEICEDPEFDGTLEAIFDKASFPPTHVAICYSTSGQFQLNTVCRQATMNKQAS